MGIIGSHVDITSEKWPPQAKTPKKPRGQTQGENGLIAHGASAPRHREGLSQAYYLAALALQHYRIIRGDQPFLLRNRGSPVSPS